MDWSVLFDKLVIPAVLAIGAWGWNRITKKKEQRKETRSVFDDIIESFVYELLDRYPLGTDVETYLKNSRGYITQEIWKVASKRGIPRNKTTEALFHAAIERGGSLLAREVTRLRQLNEQRRHELEMRK